MKKFRIIPLIVLFAGLCLFLSVRKVSAKSYYIEDFEVNVDVDQDSTFEVSEQISYRFLGEFHRVFRGITLVNKTNLEKCREDPSLQCGGFSYITITGVYDEDGNEVSVSEYTLSEETSGTEDRLNVAWEFAPDGQYFNNELFTFTLKYKVYGGVGYFDDYDLFYWNVFPPDRDFKIENGTFNITFPEDIEFSEDDLEVFYDYYAFDYTYDYEDSGYTLTLAAEDLSAYENFTVLLKFPKDIIQEYATLNLDLSPKTQDVSIDGVKIDNVQDEFSGIPPGTHDFKFEASGYKPKELSLTLKEGEEKDLRVHLEMTTWQKLIYVGIVFGNCLSCLGGIAIIILIITNYIRKGKDLGGRKTIVPWFKPPQGVSPVIVGSVKDEKVHMVDITSTIINAAVRGFVKIKETGKKKYKLIKVKPFQAEEGQKGRRVDYKVLDTVEMRILQDIFGSKDEVGTEDLKNSFYLKVPGINDEIYSEMVNRGYFAERPDKVRQKHLGLGILLVILGSILTGTLWMLTIFTCGPSLIIAGIVKVIFSFFMPAKTSKGTAIYEKCKGFRMFLHTAERFRMQKLTPEKFERFLPYAMVFGVEKQWAKKFKDIYKKPPDWYEGRDPWTTFNSVYLVRSLSTMSSSAGRVMASAPGGSSSGWSGGGWSGGGGFSGGFSGGGGGGGSAGAS